MTVIFLDVDGVITSSRDNGFRDFNLHVVAWLSWACVTAGAKIVISSTWRNSTTREFWQSVFGDVIHDDWRTANGTRFRGDEVNEWLRRHLEAEAYIILDDDKDFHAYQLPYFIQCDPHNGMLFDQMMDLRERLGIASFPSADKSVHQHPNMFGVTRDQDSLLRIETGAKVNFS
jgi:hypothetical protein